MGLPPASTERGRLAFTSMVTNGTPNKPLMTLLTVGNIITDKQNLTMLLLT